MPRRPNTPKREAFSAAKVVPEHNSVAGLLQQGLALHQQSQFKEAQAIYEKVLAIHAAHFDALQLLGTLLVQTQQFAKAIALLSKALQIKPNHAEAYNNRGVALKELYRLDEALVNYNQAIAIKPDYAEAHSNRGNALQELERLDEALASYEQAIIIKPNYAKAHSNRGNALQELERLDEALASYEKAIIIKPDYAEAHSNRGNVLKGLERLDEALASYDQAIAIKPNYAEAHFNRGVILQERERYKEALASYEQAIAIKPDYAKAYSNRGNVLKGLERLDEALASYDQAIAIKPNYAEAHFNRGVILQESHHYEKAIASYDQAIAIKPDYAKAYSNRGNALQELERLDEALASYEQAIATKPDFAEAYSNRLFCMLHHDSLSPEQIYAEHLGYSKQFEASQAASPGPYRNLPDPERRLRVGFVSGDLRNHPVANFIEPVWALLNPDSVEVWAYSNHPKEDGISNRLQGYVRNWRNVSMLSDELLFKQIQSDDIDILIDLSGHTALNRLSVFAQKPAPLQATWIGYPGTTGLSSMDYMICDRFNAPHGLYERYYSEKFARLPSTGAFAPFLSAPSINALPALANGHMTFGSFNRPSKLGSQVIEVWCQVLAALPNSRMLIGNIDNTATQHMLLEKFQDCGVRGERLSFYPKMSMLGYLELHHQVDIVLDTWPYTGGTTTNHALWMGVPVVTMQGPSRAHCQSAAALGRMGLDDWIANDKSDFVNLAVRRAIDTGALAHLRSNMRERWLMAPLRNNAMIADALSVGLRQMWRRWCAGLGPEHLDVECNME